MPEVKDKITGKVVAKMPYDTEGQMAAEKMVAENPGYEIKDGSMRSEQMYAGGGKTGYNAVGNPMYKEGGNTLKNPKKAAVMAKKEKMPSPPKEDTSEKLKELFKKWEKKHGVKGKKA
jgi:hypothetical protein